ncbi:MAG: hypothetical protein LBF41_04055, partial [Deltaproteobacteria bacterium]|nr:hypothetical protein [Deltaproteobacteria bacterium]
MNLFKTIDKIAHGVHESLKGPAGAFCGLAGSADERSLVADDGSLVSAVRVEGSLASISDERGIEIAETLAEKLGVLFEGPGHSLKAVFDHDPRGARESVAKNFAPALRAASDMGLDLAGILKSWEKAVADRAAEENLWLALWTSPAALAPTARGGKAKKSRGSLKNLPRDFFGPAVSEVAEELLSSHRGALAALEEALRRAELVFRPLSGKRLVRDIKHLIHGEVPENWTPRLPGDPFPLLLPEDSPDLFPDRAGDESFAGLAARTGREGRERPSDNQPGPFPDLFPDLFPNLFPAPYPTLKSQIFARDLEVLDGDLLKAGNLLHAPFFVTIPPREPKPFPELFRAVRARGVTLPFRMAISITSEGARGIRFKTLLARILSFSHPDNERMVLAKKALERLATEGTTIVGISFALDTAYPLLEGGTLQEAATIVRGRRSELMKLVSGWGEASLSEMTGDPLLGVAAAVPGLMPGGGPAPGAAAPLRDARSFFPSRPASAWETGLPVFRTPLGKPAPFSPASSKQAAWIDLGLSPMGAGKSVLLNTMNLAHALLPGSDKPGLVSIIDVGPSSKGLVELLKNALPPERRDEVSFKRLRLSPDCALNPFDLPL